MNLWNVLFPTSKRGNLYSIGIFGILREVFLFTMLAMNRTILLSIISILVGAYYATAQQELRITAILHAQLSGQIPKAMELYACSAIPDLSIYTVATYFNGAAITTAKFTFPKGSSAAAGQYIYLSSESTAFTQFFGFAPTYTSSTAVNYNGNDVPTLSKNGVITDVYGVIGVDGTGKNWEYTAGWAARASGKSATTTFNVADWTVRKGALKGYSTNLAAAFPVPIKTFKCSTPAPVTPTLTPIAPITPTSPISPTVKPTAAPVVPTAGTKVKVMGYNINFGGSNPAWKTVVKEENPDIAVFVEVGTWDDNNNQLLNQYVAEFNAYFTANTPYQGSVAQNTGVANTGCALMSRFPIVSTKQLNTVTLDNGSSFTPTHPLMVWGINVNGRLVYVAGFYEKCCGGFDNTRERTMEGFINYLDSLGPVPVFIMGDYNAVSPSDANPNNPDYNPAFKPAPASTLGYGPLTMLLYPNDTTYGQYSSKGVHTFTDTFRKVNSACGVSSGTCCNTSSCAYNDGSTCIERGYSFHDGTYDSRIDFIVANQFIQVNGPATVGDTSSACVGSDHFTVDNYLTL